MIGRGGVKVKFWFSIQNYGSCTLVELTGQGTAEVMRWKGSSSQTTYGANRTRNYPPSPTNQDHSFVLQPYINGNNIFTTKCCSIKLVQSRQDYVVAYLNRIHTEIVCLFATIKTKAIQSELFSFLILFLAHCVIHSLSLSSLLLSSSSSPR